jgi:hypothetical protein
VNFDSLWYSAILVVDFGMLACMKAVVVTVVGIVVVAHTYQVRSYMVGPEE